MSQRWDKRLRMPKSEGGATICEKHDFIEANFRDPEMSWEVDQVVTQAKDDGKRMEARIQELGEEANNLEEALQEMEADRDRLAARLEISDDPEMSGDKIDHLEFLLESERKHSTRLASDLQATRAELERVRRNHLRRMGSSAVLRAWQQVDPGRADALTLFAARCFSAALASMETGRG